MTWVVATPALLSHIRRAIGRSPHAWGAAGGRARAHAVRPSGSNVRRIISVFDDTGVSRPVFHVRCSTPALRCPRSDVRAPTPAVRRPWSDAAQRGGAVDGPPSPVRPPEAGRRAVPGQGREATAVPPAEERAAWLKRPPRSAEPAPHSPRGRPRRGARRDGLRRRPTPRRRWSYGSASAPVPAHRPRHTTAGRRGTPPTLPRSPRAGGPQPSSTATAARWPSPTATSLSDQPSGPWAGAGPEPT